MADQPTQPYKPKETVEIYRDLLQVEVRALITRVTELTQTMGEFFNEVNGIAVQMEKSIDDLNQLSGGLYYCREELAETKKRLDEHKDILESVHKRLGRIEAILSARATTK